MANKEPSESEKRLWHRHCSTNLLTLPLNTQSTQSTQSTQRQTKTDEDEYDFDEWLQDFQHDHQYMDDDFDAELEELKELKETLAELSPCKIHPMLLHDSVQSLLISLGRSWP